MHNLFARNFYHDKYFGSWSAHILHNSNFNTNWQQVYWIKSTGDVLHIYIKYSVYNDTTCISMIMYAN